MLVLDFHHDNHDSVGNKQLTYFKFALHTRPVLEIYVKMFQQHILQQHEIQNNSMKYHFCPISGIICRINMPHYICLSKNALQL